MGCFLLNFIKSDQKTKKNKFIIIFIFIIYFNFFKNIDVLLNPIFRYNNSFWDYLLILNNNNKSFFLFAVITLWVYNNNSFYKQNSIKINSLILILYLFYINNFNLNILTKLMLKTNFLNINLTNGLILIHPVCIYIVYSLFINIFWHYYLENNKIKKSKINIKKFNNNILLLSFSALFLGSHWSQQELNWGGWWNWDFVEIIALVFFILSSLITHININKNFNYLKFFFTKIFNYFFLFFFLIRLDLINSVHSFNSFNNLNDKINLLIYIYIIFIITIVLNNSYNKYYIYINNNIKNKSVITLLFLILLFILNIYIYINVIISFFYDIQYIELTKYLKNVFNFIFLFFFITLIKKNKLLLIISPIINNNFIFFYLIILVIIIKNIYNYKHYYKNIFHIFIIMFIIINIFYYNYQYYLINLSLIKLNLNLLNNINTLNDNFYHLMCLYYYNNNNYLFLINNYYCYNNNILFNSVFNETLLNNILLFNSNTNILYKIDKQFLIFNFNVLWNYYFIFLLILLFSNKINKKIR